MKKYEVPSEFFTMHLRAKPMAERGELILKRDALAIYSTGKDIYIYPESRRIAGLSARLEGLVSLVNNYSLNPEDFNVHLQTRDPLGVLIANIGSCGNAKIYCDGETTYFAFETADANSLTLNVEGLRHILSQIEGFKSRMKRKRA